MKLSAVVSTLLMFPCLVMADTFVVPPYPSIQAAVDAASDGDTVLVMPGTYYENVDLQGKAITLRSDEDGSAATPDDIAPEITIIDGSGLDSVVRSESGDYASFVLNGFTITNGHADNGGGIYSKRTNPTVINNLITANSAVWRGGGFYCNPYSPIAGNYPITLEDNTITFNVTEELSGGGISCGAGQNNTLTITNNVITDNEATGGSGGGIDCSAGDLDVLNNLISNNDCKYSGGGIICEGTYVKIVNNTIENNDIHHGFGGGINCGASWRVRIYNNHIEGNRSIDDSPGNRGIGGGLFCNSGFCPNLRIINNVIVYNEAITTASDNHYCGCGGGIYLGGGLSGQGRLPAEQHDLLQYGFVLRFHGELGQFGIRLGTDELARTVHAARFRGAHHELRLLSELAMGVCLESDSS